MLALFLWVWADKILKAGAKLEPLVICSEAHNQWSPSTGKDLCVELIAAFSYYVLPTWGQCIQLSSVPQSQENSRVVWWKGWIHKPYWSLNKFVWSPKAHTHTCVLTHTQTNSCGFASAALCVACSVPPPELHAFAQEFFLTLSVQVFQKTPTKREWGLESGSPDRWWIVISLPKCFKKQKHLAVGWLIVKGTQTKVKIECIRCSSIILKVEVSPSILYEKKAVCIEAFSFFILWDLYDLVLCVFYGKKSQYIY